MPPQTTSEPSASGPSSWRPRLRNRAELQVVVRFFVQPRGDGDDFESLVNSLQDQPLGRSELVDSGSRRTSGGRDLRPAFRVKTE